MTETITPEMQAVIDRVKKLLNLAAANPNEHEAAAATAKAQAMLAEHNLDVATVEKESSQEGKREQLKVDGGFYTYQRQLWTAVASLNFCVYWPQKYATKAWRYVDEYGTATSRKRVETTRKIVSVMRYRHVLVGRIANTRSTQVMTEYLQAAIERVTAEHVRGRNNTYMLSSWAVAFRKGCAARIVEMVEDQREAHLAAEREKERKALRRSKGASTSTALTLASFSQTEEDANNDFIHGAGWSAKQAARRAERAAERKARIDAWTKWCAENPEEAKRMADEDRKREERNASRRRGRSYREPRDSMDMSAYYAGYDAARKISINLQTAAPKDSARISGPKVMHI